MKKMKILLVNDDGYKAEGIKALEKVLSEYGHRIYVIAPSEEQSGKSHSMTLSHPLYATEYGIGHFHVSGTPADCIISGLKSDLLGDKPDLIVSGINHGYNLSTDIIYSGTCGAARQATFYGYKAIAISEERTKDRVYAFERSARFLAEHLDEFVALIKEREFLNINIPSSFSGSYDFASTGEISYDDIFSVERVEDGRYKLTNTSCEITYHNVDGKKHPHDFELCSNGIASISLVELVPECSTERG